ncbi:MAG: FMN-binding protein [Pseudomonadota bacterium]
MGDIIRMIVVLSCICGVSGFALSYLKMTTAPAIEEQVMTYVQGPAIHSVFTDIDNDPIADRKKFSTADGKEFTVFPGQKGGKLVGVCIEGFGTGFGGEIGVMVGFDVARDALMGIGITTMSETPGLGTVIAGKNFTSQFVGQGLDAKAKSQGGTLDTISGATISSNGAIAGLNKAAQIYTQLKPEIVKTWP